jgi:hypothetical protein
LNLVGTQKFWAISRLIFELCAVEQIKPITRR